MPVKTFAIKWHHQWKFDISLNRLNCFKSNKDTYFKRHFFLCHSLVINHKYEFKILKIWFQWWKCWSFSYLDGDPNVEFCRRQGRKSALSWMSNVHANFHLCTNAWWSSFSTAGSIVTFNEKKRSPKGCENRDWKL